MGGIVSSRAFLPPPATYSKKSLGGDFLWIPSNESSEDQIPAVFHRIQCEDDSEEPFTLLFSHGNAEDIGQMVRWISVLSSFLGVNVITYDYMGYGIHSGDPSERACYNDVESVYDYLVKVENISPRKIILFGRSLGSGPTVHLGARLWERYDQRYHSGSWSLMNCFSSRKSSTGVEDEGEAKKNYPLAAVILQSPITSAIRVVSDTLAILPLDIFSNIDKIHKIRSPIFIIHGTDDLVVPYEHGKELFEKSGDAGWEFLSLRGAGHNNIEADYGDEFLEGLQKFVTFLTEQSGGKSEETKEKKHKRKHEEDLEEDVSDEGEEES